MQVGQREVLCVLRAQAGDRDATNQLFLILQDPLHRFLRSLGADEHQAEDLLQAVFVTIHRKLRWLREPNLLGPWALRIAYRQALRVLAREQREQDRLDAVVDLDAIPADAPTVFAEEDLDRLLAGLTAGARAVLALHYQQGLELAEVADVLGIPLGTVKSRLGYGLATLRTRLEPPAASPARRRRRT